MNQLLAREGGEGGAGFCALCTGCTRSARGLFVALLCLFRGLPLEIWAFLWLSHHLERSSLLVQKVKSEQVFRGSIEHLERSMSDFRIRSLGKLLSIWYTELGVVNCVLYREMVRSVGTLSLHLLLAWSQ